jgi:hypothetical protein
VRYRFIVAKEDYSTRIFELDPIDATNAIAGYTVRLRQSAALQTPIPYTRVFIELNPTSGYKNNESYNVTLTILSPYGSLSEYNIDINAPGVNETATGNNPYGETLTVPITITGATTGDAIKITYTYTEATTGTITTTRTFLIETTPADYTWGGLRDTDYGFTTFEKALVATVGTILAAGFGFLFAGALIGGLIGLLMLGFWYYLGFLTLWMILPTVFGGLFLIIWRASA